MSSETRRVIRLADCASFQEGYVNPSQTEPSYFGDDIKWLRATDLNNGFVFETGRRLSKKGFESAGKSATLFAPGTLAISKSGTIGRIGILQDYMCGNRAVINIKPTPNCDTRFIFYTLLLSRPEIETLAEGSVQKNLYVSTLGNLKIALPPLTEQRAISSVLGSLDDRIALLRGTNTTLEGIAQALFKSWFVDFDPVRSKMEGREPSGMDEITAALFPDELEESEFGTVPKGWSVSTVGESFVLTMGQSPPGDTYSEDDNGLPFYQGRTDFGFRFPTKRMYCSAPTRIAEVGDTLVSVRAPVGDVNMAIERCCVGRGVASVRHPKSFRSFTFYAMRGLGARFDNFDSEGTIFGSITKKDFQALPVIKPTMEALSAYDEISASIDTKIVENEEMIRTLSTLRDTLLPRLLSGQLQITDESEELMALAA